MTKNIFMKQNFSLIILLALIVLSVFYVANQGTYNLYLEPVPKVSQQDNVAQITFVVTVPDEIEKLEIQILHLIDVYSYDAYEMTKDSQNPFIFNTALEFPKGTLIRYRYAIQSNEWEYLADKNPAFRVLIVPENNAEVHGSPFLFN